MFLYKFNNNGGRKLPPVKSFVFSVVFQAFKAFVADYVLNAARVDCSLVGAYADSD